MIVGDLADVDLLDRIMKEEGIEGVIHLAADSLVGESMEKPGKYYRNNVANGINLLEAMVNNGVEYIVFSSTAAVYGEPEEIPITESHPANPKILMVKANYFEKILKRYDEIYNLRYVSLRYFNAAGGSFRPDREAHDPETHLIPIVLRKPWESGKALYIWG